MNVAKASTLLVLTMTLSGCMNHQLMYPADPAEREQAMVLPAKDPGAAAAMSTVVPGLGEMYAGNLFDGTCTMLRQGTLLGVMLLGSAMSSSSGGAGATGALMALGGSLTYLMGWAWAMNAGYDAADQYNRSLSHIRLQVKKLNSSLPTRMAPEGSVGGAATADTIR